MFRMFCRHLVQLGVTLKCSLIHVILVILNILMSSYNLADSFLSNWDYYFLLKQYHFIEYLKIKEKGLVFKSKLSLIDFIVFFLSNQFYMKIVEVKDDRKSLPTRGLKGSPQIWLQEKRERDAQLWDTDNSNYWIVENKLYDLNSFVDQHPGGKNWLTMTKGQDVTQFFIIHHLNEKGARETLKKYYVGETKNKVSRFTFETVKRQLLKEMSVAQIQSEQKSKIHAFIILGLLLLSIFITAKTINMPEHPYLPYIFCSLASILLVGMVGIGHNFVHHKQNYFKYFFVATGFTHNEWQVMHALSHHIYPNLELDYQAAALQPIGYFLRNKPQNPFYTEIILVVSFIFIQPLNLFLKVFVVPITKRKLPQLWYLVPTLVFLTFYLATGDWAKALKFHLFIYCLFGLIFNRVLFCGHRLQELWTEGAERIQDYGEHTILSTNDTDTKIQGLLSYLLLGGFNIHTPHHFFPTADLSALPQILGVIDRVCNQKGIKRFSTNRFNCFISLSKGILNRIPFLRK